MPEKGLSMPDIPPPPEKGSDWLAWLRWAALMIAALIGLWQTASAVKVADENQKAMQMVSAKLAKMEFPVTPQPVSNDK
jgi:hypothetical protein